MTVGFLIVGVILMFIIPIPSPILDILLTLNISVSLVILLNTVHAKEPLEMSIFPSLLLVTTMFRLGLNLTSTKLILGQGDAGGVIDAFAKFVAGNNMVVGFIVFLIITLVNFLVIVKGAERVSEVAARFTLDAMPGKQMAIDADLNSGLINEAEAKARRKKVQQEADFYGAMDGAGKFVKGDSIAGIVITFVNLIGGIILGMMRGETIMDALEIYALLTIGDGLVSQVPALMISIANGIIVTRAGSESNLSQDFLRQLFKNQKVLLLASGVCIILAFTGMPTIPFLAIAVALFLLSRKVKDEVKAAVEKVSPEEKQKQTQAEDIRKPENVVSLLQVDPIELEFGYGIIPLADASQGGDLLDRVVMIRRQLAMELGMVVPVIRLRDNIQLAPYQYCIKVKGVEVSRGELQNDSLLAMDPGTAEGGLKGKETIEPAFGLPAVWIPVNQRDIAEMKGYTIVDLPSVIATHLTQVIKKYANKLLGRQEVQTIIDSVKETNPVIVEELIPKLMSIGEVQKVLGNLLREEICIRDMVTILETLADYATHTRDADVLTEYVRQALSRSISQKYIDKSTSNGVITIDPALEQELAAAVQKSDFGSYIAIAPERMEILINNLSKQVKNVLATGEQPIILTSPGLRPYFKRMIEGVIPSLVVLSYNEIDSDADIKSIGMLTA
ncbi:MAG: flagellar biosynthesis protein FlhA [Clostridiales bacterium]|nr:flagellar biosynthesis protein FlhA [Clostridiales bacterium]